MNSPSVCWLDSISWPVWLQNESRSLIDPGSVAVISGISPDGIPAIVFLVL